MNFPGRIRAKFASSISEIEESETFLWTKIMHVGEVDHLEVETFMYEMWRTDHIPLGIESSGESSSFSFNFKRVKSFKLSARKLIFRSRTNPVFFGFGNINVSDIKISFDKELEQFFSARVVQENDSISLKVKNHKKNEVTNELTSKLIDLEKRAFTTGKRFSASKAQTSGSGAKSFTYIIKEPDVLDCLSQLKPKIYNIEMLSPLRHSESENPVSNTKIDLLDKILPVKEITQKDLKLKNGTLYSPFEFSYQINTSELNLYSNLSSWNIKQAKIKVPGFDQPVITKLPVFYEEDPPPHFNGEDRTETILREEINKIIQPSTDLSAEEEQKLFEKLYEFQIDGVKTLTTNRSVLFANEPGLGKTTQITFAIKYLLKKREMKSTLIVTDDNLTGDVAISEKTGSYFGWYGCLQKFAPELSTNIIKSEFNDIISELTKPFQVQIISYRLLATVLTSKNLKKEVFKNFECLILEDTEYFRKNQDNFARFINSIAPKFNWIITNLEIDVYAQNILTSLDPDTYLSHNYDDVRTQLPAINESDFWINMDKDHLDEFDQTFFHTKNSLQHIFDTGNPFRFQSKLFLSIHQLNQASNFPSDNIESNKTRLLLTHINSIRSNKRQAIIFSQYDKAGIQKLASLFDRESISYKKYSQGMTMDELSNAVSDFEENKSITVLLVDTQAMKAKTHLVYAPYIIHFDQWWTPISKWNLENKINGKFNKPITVLNYFTKGTLDEEIRSVLFQKEMIDREKFSNIGADAYSKVLSEDEWSKIFGLEKKVKPPEEKRENGDNSEDE